MENIFSIADCYVKDSVQDPRTLSIQVASASHSTHENHLKVICTEIASVTCNLENNAQSIVKAYDSLIKTER